MAEIFEIALTRLLKDGKHVAKWIKTYTGRRKRRFIVVPPQIVDQMVTSLRGNPTLMAINLDYDLKSTVKLMLNDDTNFERLISFLKASPCFNLVLIRTYMEQLIKFFNEPNVKRIVFVTSDVSLFDNLKYKGAKFAYPSSSFTVDLDPSQQDEIKNYIEMINGRKKKLKIEFNDVKSLCRDYEKKII